MDICKNRIDATITRIDQIECQQTRSALTRTYLRELERLANKLEHVYYKYHLRKHDISELNNQHDIEVFRTERGLQSLMPAIVHLNTLSCDEP
jgi:predicted patatin/cPLA2 family phospholipase